ncbi:uncharacterized protein LOC131605004 [Vicia villosa]|uniref:uncharacterized protein LOC131605004 n=1 Tax=Vicia villosa TaxID=3911 RepID=UPI00273AF226|nr:uncharacterized protein LOC131605004 [Vicia villosa]
MKDILNVRSLVNTHQTVWNAMCLKGKFSCGIFYQACSAGNRLPWSSVCMRNLARPCAVFIFWLLCHRRLTTRSRLHRLGFISQTVCVFCDKEETDNHLFFDCEETKGIWSPILHWLQVAHSPNQWDDDYDWIIKMGNRKGWRAKLFKLAIVETVYGVWQHRNRAVFGKRCNQTQTIKEIMEKIVFRGWFCRKLKPHVASLMVF